MKTRKGKNLETSEKAAFFEKMAEAIDYYLSEEQYLSAYVVAFSFLEDRIGALYAERCRVEGVVPATNAKFVEQIHQLQGAGDLPPKLASACLAKRGQRNELFHNAMWNLDGFTEKAAKAVLQVARQANNARTRQQRAFAKSEAAA
jgi:hypothetical protein